MLTHDKIALFYVHMLDGSYSNVCRKTDLHYFFCLFFNTAALLTVTAMRLSWMVSLVIVKISRPIGLYSLIAGVVFSAPELNFIMLYMALDRGWLIFIFEFLSCVSMQCMQRALLIWQIRPSVRLSVRLSN